MYNIIKIMLFLFNSYFIKDFFFRFIVIKVIENLKKKNVNQISNKINF
jgi:hypothetical protein